MRQKSETLILSPTLHLSKSSNCSNCDIYKSSFTTLCHQFIMATHFLNLSLFYKYNLSTCLIVLNLCAMINDVLPCDRFLNADCILFSVSTSRALVASSNIMIGGFFKNILAMEIRCFCPPESFVPRSPTTVSKPAGNSSTNDLNCAGRQLH